MTLKYQRNLRMRDLEEVADLPEQAQAVELVARCYGIEPDAARDLEVSEFMTCVQEVAERNGIDLGDETTDN